MADAPQATLPIDSIFHPSDLTEASELAFAHALQIALRSQGSLAIFHARPDRESSPRWEDFPPVRGTLERWKLLPAKSSRMDVAKLGIRVEKISGHGPDPLASIVTYLQDHPAQLLVLATHGREGLPRWLKRAVAEPVARKVHLMTLFVPHGVRGFVGVEDGRVTLERVLVPVDHEPRAQPAITVAAAFGRALGGEDSRFVVLHVGEPGDMPTIRIPEPRRGTWQRITRSGRAPDEILRVSDEFGPDLIVMTTRGREGFLDALRGTTTEQVLRHAPCPVLTIPEA